MPPIEVSILIVLKVLDHLLGCPLDPLWGLRLRALVPSQGAEVLGLGLDNSARVVVGEWVLGVLELGFGSVGVAIAERPRVWGDRRLNSESGFCGGLPIERGGEVGWEELSVAEEWGFQ